jgi:hypothetical protein
MLPNVPQSEFNHLSKKKIIVWVCDNLNKNYIYTEVAKKMENYVRKQFTEGKFRQVNNTQEFAKALTSDLQAVSKGYFKKLCPLSETLFVIEGNEKIRGQFERDEKGEVVAAIGIISDGSKPRVPKTREKLEKPESAENETLRDDASRTSQISSIQYSERN